MIPFERSFASHPRADNWHLTKNGDVTPRGVFLNANKRFWFTCPDCPHDINPKLAGVARGFWCGYCSSPPKILCKNPECQWCHEHSFASHPRSIYWHSTINGDVTPRDVFLNCHEPFWFKCDNCPHNYKKIIANMTKGIGCPYCGLKKLCDDPECQWCHEHSFASHPRSVNWHPTLNGDVTPRDVFSGSDKKIWFTCPDCRHDINPRLFKVAQGKWCCYCSSGKLCDDPECQWCHEHSFASHPRSVNWHPTLNGDVTPRDVFLNCHEPFWFTCPDCHHDIKPSLDNVAQGFWCVYCSSKKLCDDPECQWCHEHSFASHPRAINWHPTLNGDVTPRDVFLNANKPFWFTCPDCRHDINPRLGSVASGQWCGICRNKTEKKFHNFAKEIFPNIKSQVRPEGTKLPMDMYTPENQTYHEIDGDQHFVDNNFFTSRTAEENRNHDVTKMIIALRDEGRLVIRIYQPWVWRDKGDWQKKWHDVVSRIDQDKPAVYFIGPEGIYDKHKEDLRRKLGNRFEMKSIV